MNEFQESAKKKKERKRRAEGERQEAEEAAKELGLGVCTEPPHSG